jgi:leucyl aminopeptidase
MKVRVVSKTKADTRIVPAFEDRGAPRPAVPGATALLRALERTGDFSGRFLEVAVLPVGRRPLKRIIVVGAGRRRDLTPSRVRLWAGQAARRARDLGAASIAIEVPQLDGELSSTAIEVAVEGVCLGGYRFTRYRSAPGPRAAERLEILVRGAARARSGIEPSAQRGAVHGHAVALARNLIATPGQDLTPEVLAARAKEIARASGARIQVMGVPEMKRLRMGAVLAVGRGSVNPPRFIVLERGPARGARASGSAKTPTIVLIGKGVTFDTGGISLKPKEGMGRMKYDMAGAAAVLGVFSALPSLELPFRVVGLVPSAENMPDAAALKPGDIIRAMDGTTIDVGNTDAEGRLLLADALCFAKRYQPEVVIDLATLTGAISLALGRAAAGLFTADDTLARELTAAGEHAGERLWRMPLWDSYADELRRGIADLENSGGREGGACIAAAFLAHFARGLRWAHLDIANTAWAFSDTPLEPNGPTGFGVRLLVQWLRTRADARSGP